MGLSVTVVAPSRRLTRQEYIAAELGVTFTTPEKKVVDNLIVGITAAIEAFCNAPSFARESVTETLPGFDELTIELLRRPVLSVSAVSVDSETVTDYAIEDADAGSLYREAGWDWTAQHRFSLNGRQRWPASGHPAPGREEPLISASYVGGYILPDQWLVEVNAVTVTAGDQSLNSSGLFPALLKAGDIVVTSGFATAENNGRFLVSGTPTTSKIVVSGAALVDESPFAGQNVAFHPPASCRSFDGLHQAAIICVKSAWLTREDDPSIVERQVGQLRTRRTEGFNADPTLAITGGAIGFLRPWIRSF